MKNENLSKLVLRRISEVAAKEPDLEPELLAERFGISIERLRHIVPTAGRRLTPWVLNQCARASGSGASLRSSVTCRHCQTPIYIRNHAQHEKACAIHTEEERARYRERRTYAK